MPTFRCPHCGRRFSLIEVPGPTIPCPGCGESVSAGRPAGAPSKGTPKPAAAPPASAGQTEAAGQPEAATGGRKISLKRTCPACGAQYPGEQIKCPQCGIGYTAAKIQRDSAAEEGGAFSPEKKGIQAGVVGGIVMIAIAAIWFFVGLANDVIFFYPPILAVIGGYAIIKGLATGNLAGSSAPGRRRR